MAGEFSENSVSWQVQQLQRRFSEWMEHWGESNAPDLPSVPGLPDWLARGVIYLAVALSAIWLSWAIARLFFPDLQRWLSEVGTRLRPTTPQGGTGGSALSAAAWLERARHWQQQGEYREACRALYMAMLERLHASDRVPHNASRTDGEYRTCTERLPQPQPYRVLISAHERLCFGEEAISNEMWQQCQQAYQAIEED